MLHEDEGPSLDFKRDQYGFERVDKETKSELLKDILAFAKAFRRTDAYILVGVEEIRGGRSRVVGVDTHLDDAKLQQFVNSKTQRPVTFSYREVSHDDCSIGVIHIPLQSRPLYPKATFGKLPKHTVYVRRGSSTDIASPEEIAHMRAPDVPSAPSPSMEISLVDRTTGESLGDSVRIDRCTWYEVPLRRDIPAYTPGIPISMGTFQIAHVDPLANSDFLREVAAYLEPVACFPVSLEMRNTGGVVIHDAKLALELRDPDRQCELLASQDRPARPYSRTILSSLTGPSAVAHSDVFVIREGANWKIQCDFGKVQPRATVRLIDDVLIGSRTAGDVTIRGMVYADNIHDPISVGIQLSFRHGSHLLTVEEIRRMATSLANDQ